MMKAFNWLGGWLRGRKTARTAAPDPEAVKRFRERVRVMPEDDPLWPGLIAVLDAKVLAEANYAATCRTAEQSHQATGRLAALIELRHELEALPQEVRQDGAG